jgi:PEP-CTERM motif
MNRFLKLCIFASALILSTAGQCNIITYNFAGTLTSSLGTLNSGDAFSGSYTVDTTIAATGNSTFSVFNNLTGVSLTIGSFTANIGPGSGLPEIQQDDVAGADRYALIGRNPTGSSQIDGLDITLIGFRLDDTTGTAISDALVLLTNPTLSSFTSNSLLLFFGTSTDPVREVVSGELSSLSVPEPATLALVGLGLAGISYQRRRQVTKE